MVNSLFTRAFALLFISSLLYSMSYEMLRPIISIYASDLGASGIEIGIVFSALVFSAMVLRFPVGRWIDSHGRRGMILVGTIIYTIAPLLYSLCTNTEQLIAVRAFHGIGMATFSTAAVALVVDIVPKNRLGEAMGLFGISIGTAMSLGPALVGYLLEVLGFTQTFYVFSIFAFASFIAATRVRDVPGIITGERGRLLDALKDVNVLTASTGIFFTAVVWGTIVTFLPLYLYESLGIAAWGVGIFFTVFALSTIVTRPIIGRLSDRRGRMVVLVPAMCLAAVSTVALGFATEMVFFVVLAVIFGLGQGSTHPILNKHIRAYRL